MSSLVFLTIWLYACRSTSPPAHPPEDNQRFNWALTNVNAGECPQRGAFSYLDLPLGEGLISMGVPCYQEDIHALNLWACRFQLSDEYQTKANQRRRRIKDEGESKTKTNNSLTQHHPDGCLFLEAFKYQHLSGGTTQAIYSKEPKDPAGAPCFLYYRIHADAHPGVNRRH